MPWLEWLDRKKDLEAASRVPHRLLEPVPELSVGDDAHENLLIQGDNLDALKALLPYYGGQVKCIFIDPPYNTKSAVSEYYDDNLEHSQWLSMMYPRIELLRKLLRPDGSMWVTLDDNEAHYFKAIADEIFSRSNFLGDVAWQHSVQGKNDAKGFSAHHNHLFAYRRSDKFTMGRVPRSEEHNVNYRNPDDDPRGPWRSGDVRSPNPRANLRFPVTTPSGNVIPPPPNGWRWSQDTFAEKVSSGEITFVDNETRVLRKIYLADQEGRVPESIWFADYAGTTREATNEVRALVPDVTDFGTPKPERLIRAILEIATEEGDIVLDSFLGSGTTAAVAHKMKRRWVGIERGEHAQTLCLPRLTKVVRGEQGGVSQAVGWTGGGGFRFYRLGSAVFDEHGNIQGNVRFKHLAAHLWFAETGTPRLNLNARSALLGVHDETAYYLLFNGILGDRRPDSGNVLTTKLLDELPEPPDGVKQRVIFGEACRIGPERLARMGITFKQIPYDIHAR